MPSPITFRMFSILLGVATVFSFSPLFAEEAPIKRSATKVDLRAKQLFDKALELMEFKEFERGVAMLETVIRDNQGNILGYRAHMVLGKHFLNINQTDQAQSHFKLLTRLLTPKAGEGERNEEIEQLFRESLFQSGLCFYKAGQYTSAFPVFRRLTEIASQSEWANKAYYYIGMSHYNLKNWNKAIDALSLVGTEMEQREEMGLIEIGQRFYTKIVDDDVPVLKRLGRDASVVVDVSSGDREVLVGVPVAGRKNELMCSAPTSVGIPKPNDGIIQILGGDILNVTYADETTVDGQKDIVRTSKVKAVSTGVIGFYKGDFATPSPIAYPGDFQHIMLKDADLDTSVKAEKITLRVSSRYKEKQSEDEEGDERDAMDIFADIEEEKEVWRERDAIEVTLMEDGEGGMIRGGKFKARFILGSIDEGLNTSDEILTCDENDEIEVRYLDDVHIYGSEPRESIVVLPVSGSIRAGVSVAQYKVNDLLLNVKKNQVEAEASLGLGQIYREMGLVRRANENAGIALKKVNETLSKKGKISESRLIEEAFKTKWEAEFLKEDFEAATATCKTFNTMYPESVLADQALMTLSRTLFQRGDFDEAIISFRGVLGLKNPISAAEAQFSIGEVMATRAEKQLEFDKNTGESRDPMLAYKSAMSAAVEEYRKTFESYPESPFAAKSLGKVVRFYVKEGDNSQAADLLERVFLDFPDAPFLDEMLMLWSEVAFKMNKIELAIAKLRQLTFEYPSSKYKTQAKRKLNNLQRVLAKQRSN